MATSVGNIVVNVTPGNDMAEEIRNIVREEVAAIADAAYWNTEEQSVERAVQALRFAAEDRITNREENATP